MYVCVHVYRELQGVLVSIDIEGELLCSYLGTDPTLFSATRTMDGARTQNNFEVKPFQRFIQDCWRHCKYLATPTDAHACMRVYTSH